MGQVGSSIACTYIDESEQDYLLHVPTSRMQQQQQQFSRGKFGRFLQDQEQESEEAPEDLTLLVPDECLEWVFSKLSPGERTRSSLVCRRWHRLEGRSRTTLSLLATAELTPHLTRICSRFAQLTKISLRCDRREPSIGDRALILIARHCKSLAKLKLKGCKDFTDEGLDHFSRALPGSQLRKFSSAACGFGPLGLNLLLQRCTHLESLAVKRLRGLSSSSDHILVGPSCSRLRKLCLKELRSARFFGPLVVSSTNLQVLRLSKNLGHWDKILEAMLVNLPNLLELHLERLQVSDRGLQAIAGCKSLEALYLVKAPDCTNFGLSAIAFGCRALKRLRLDGWRSGRIGDEGLISIAKRCRELQELVLIRLSISVGSLTILGSNCPGLERLAICNCESFGDAELCCIAARFRSLKKLCIRSCSISNLGIEGLGSGSPALTRLKIRNCNQVTPEGIAAVRVRMMRPVWISLLNDVLPAIVPEVEEEAEIVPGNNRIHRVLQGGSQIMKSKLNWATGNAAVVSCYCVKS